MAGESGDVPDRCTTLAGPSSFPTTRWTLVLAAGDPNSSGRRADSRATNGGHSAWVIERIWHTIYRRRNAMQLKRRTIGDLFHRYRSMGYRPPGHACSGLQTARWQD